MEKGAVMNTLLFLYKHYTRLSAIVNSPLITSASPDDSTIPAIIL